LGFDINVNGSLKNDYVLQGILKASKDDKAIYTRNAEQVIVHDKIF
jgi:hypothetical protein